MLLQIQDLFLISSRSHSSLGKAIFFHLYKVALDQDLAGIKFEIINWDTQAVGFYKSLGAKRADNFLQYSLKDDNIERLVKFFYQ